MQQKMVLYKSCHRCNRWHRLQNDFPDRNIVASSVAKEEKRISGSALIEHRSNIILLRITRIKKEETKQNPTHGRSTQSN